MVQKLKFRSWADICSADAKYVLDVKDYGVQGTGITLDNALVNAQVKLEKEIKRRLQEGNSLPREAARHYNGVLGGMWVDVEVVSG